MALCACRQFLFHWHQACHPASECSECRNKSRLLIKRKKKTFGITSSWQFNVGKEMHGHVPALKWIMAVGSYCHSSFLKHLLCCKRTKKKKLIYFNERVSIQRYPHLTGRKPWWILTDVLCRNLMMIKQNEKAASNAQKNAKVNLNYSKSKPAPHLRTTWGGK